MRSVCMNRKSLIIFFIILTSVLIFSCGEKVIVEDVRGSRLEKLNSEDKKNSILIIDTRTNKEYKSNHIEHAINIPKDEIKSRIIEISDWLEKPIYLYANNNDESFEAAKLFVRYGCKKVYNADGIEQYSYKMIKYNSVRGIKFEELMKDDNILIVDCRNKRVFKISHISGAISVPFMHLEKNLHKLSKEKKLLLYDSVGTASARAARELLKLGYNDIYVSIDGTNDYPFVLVNED